MSQLFKKIAKKHKKIDILVIATGIYGAIGKLHETKLEDWKEAVDVNLFGTVNAISNAFPIISKNNNSKIVIFAGGGEGPKPHFSSYVSSKAATIRLMETLAQELKEFGIEINAIAPGAVVSQFNDRLIKAGAKKAGDAAYKEALEQVKGERETVPPEKVAELALFLSTVDSGGVTGRTFSTIHDPWKSIAQFKKDLMESDVYTFRRIKPKDRGYDWK
jgi:NAD(P)-dependent dehydrogenase (short-subunit alcohol dehydrogenase family)